MIYLTKIYLGAYIIGTVFAEDAIINTTTTNTHNPYPQVYSLIVKSDTSIIVTKQSVKSIYKAFYKCCLI